jgi:hypothetical protein
MPGDITMGDSHTGNTLSEQEENINQDINYGPLGPVLMSMRITGLYHDTKHSPRPVSAKWRWVMMIYSCLVLLCVWGTLVKQGSSFFVNPLTFDNLIKDFFFFLMELESALVFTICFVACENEKMIPAMLHAAIELHSLSIRKQMPYRCVIPVILTIVSWLIVIFTIISDIALFFYIARNRSLSTDVPFTHTYDKIVMIRGFMVVAKFYIHCAWSITILFIYTVCSFIIHELSNFNEEIATESSFPMTAASIREWSQRHLKLGDLVSMADNCMRAILAIILFMSVVRICFDLYYIENYLNGTKSPFNVVFLIINIMRLFLVCSTAASVNTQVC